MSDEYIRSLWTEEDIGILGWYMSPIYAFGITDWLEGDIPRAEFLLDIDYAFERIQTQPGIWQVYTAPVTLVFIDPCDVLVDIGADEQVGRMPNSLWILDIERIPVSDPRNERKISDQWSIDADEGQVILETARFDMYVRQRPRWISSFRLGFEKRGGISFAKERFDQP